MLANIILLAGTLSVALFITAIIFLSRTINWLTKLAFGLTTINMSLWNVAIFVADNVRQHLYFWNNIIFLFPTIGLVGLFVFVSIQRAHVKHMSIKMVVGSRVTFAVLILSTFIQLLSIVSNKIFTSIYISSEGSYVFMRGPMYFVYILGVLTLIALTAARVIQSWRYSDKHSQERRALKAVAFTILAVLAYGLLMNVVIPVVTGSQKFISLGALSLDIFSFGLALSIVRYRLFDIRFYVIRAVAYLFSLSLIALLFVVITFVVTSLVTHGNLNAPSERFFYALLAVVLAIIFPWIKQKFDTVTKTLFYRDAYDPQVFLDQLNQALVSNIELDKLLGLCSQIIETTIKAEFCIFGIRETGFRDVRIFGTAKKNFSPEDIDVARKMTPHIGMNVVVADYLPVEANMLKKVLDRNNIAVLVRLIPEFVRSKDGAEGLGYILLGQKRSGNKYTPQDVKILGIVANELVIAIQNALHFEEIQRFNVTLQEQIDEATRRLRQTNQKLLELDEAKDDFISMASHQLRTPLTSVKGYISMVLDGDAGRINQQQAKMLRQAFTSAQHMVYLITDLLNISRLKTGKFVIDASPTDLSELVHEEVGGLQETAKLKGIKLSYQKPAGFPKLLLDEVKTRQVVMNFIDNALYYTPAGGRVQVELEEKASVIELRVVDNGMGVPKSEQHHLFTKFYRAGNARKARPDGTGLGLFMAKKVITAQGGSVLFSSIEGHGSTFGFIFSKSKLAAPPSPTVKMPVANNAVAIAKH